MSRFFCLESEKRGVEETGSSSSSRFPFLSRFVMETRWVEDFNSDLSSNLRIIIRDEGLKVSKIKEERSWSYISGRNLELWCNNIIETRILFVNKLQNSNSIIHYFRIALWMNRISLDTVCNGKNITFPISFSPIIHHCREKNLSPFILKIPAYTFTHSCFQHYYHSSKEKPAQIVWIFLHILR